MNDQPNGSASRGDGAAPAPSLVDAVRAWLRAARRFRNGENSVRDTLEELIEERDDAEAPIAEDERALFANILDLRDRTVHDVMVPRADITAIDQAAKRSQVIALMIREGHSRLPVYGESLDDAIGMVHIRDVAVGPEDAAFTLSKIVRRVLFVSPSMQVLELLLEMRVTRSHMALVVDEHGGVDGLVTIEDLVAEIVGEIEDEHDRGGGPAFVKRTDGSLNADARATLEDLEKITGPVVTEEERAEIDTLGGLVFSLVGRVPIRGELIRHPSGLEFEVIDADPRRIKRLRVRGVSGEAAELA